MPSWELFDAQPDDYKEAILPAEIWRRVSVEAGTTIGWERYIGTRGVSIGIDHFGASAPGKELFQRFGLTAERVFEAAMALMEEETQ